MMPVYSLSIAGAAAVSAEALGVQLTRRERWTQRTDTLSLTVPRGLARPFPLQPGQQVTVYADGAPFFAGRVPNQAARLAASDQAVAISLLGPWDTLDHWPALRNRNGALAWSDVLADTTQLTPRWDNFANTSHTDTVLAGVAAFYAMAPVEWILRASPPFILGTWPAGIKVPAWQEVSGLMVSQVVQQCLYWMPDVATWVDYTGPVPVLNAQRMQGSSSVYFVSLDRAPTPYGFVSAMDTASEVPVQVTLGQDGVSAADLTLRYDMLPSVVNIVTENSSGAYVSTQRYPTSTSPNARDALWVLRDSVPDGGSALALYEALATLRLEGTLTLDAGDGRPDPRARPGRVWDILGDDVATGRGTAIAWTQSVSDDLATGVTTCTLGYPRHLGVSDFLSLGARAARLYGV